MPGPSARRTLSPPRAEVPRRVSRRRAARRVARRAAARSECLGSRATCAPPALHEWGWMRERGRVRVRAGGRVHAQVVYRATHAPPALSLPRAASPPEAASPCALPSESRISSRGRISLRSPSEGRQHQAAGEQRASASGALGGGWHAKVASVRGGARIQHPGAAVGQPTGRGSVRRGPP